MFVLQSKEISDSKNWDQIKYYPNDWKLKGTSMNIDGMKRWKIQLQESCAGEQEERKS